MPLTTWRCESYAIGFYSALVQPIFAGHSTRTSTQTVFLWFPRTGSRPTWHKQLSRNSTRMQSCFRTAMYTVSPRRMRLTMRSKRLSKSVDSTRWSLTKSESECPSETCVSTRTLSTQSWNWSKSGLWSKLTVSIWLVEAFSQWSINLKIWGITLTKSTRNTTLSASIASSTKKLRD